MIFDSFSDVKKHSKCVCRFTPAQGFESLRLRLQEELLRLLLFYVVENLIKICYDPCNRHISEIDMTTYLGLYIMINAFCIILVMAFLLHSRVGMGAMVPQRRFAHAVNMLIVFFASDTLWYAMDCGCLPRVHWISLCLKSIYFLSASASGYLWFLYMETLTGAESKG